MDVSTYVDVLKNTQERRWKSWKIAHRKFILFTPLLFYHVIILHTRPHIMYNLFCYSIPHSRSFFIQTSSLAFVVLILLSLLFVVLYSRWYRDSYDEFSNWYEFMVSSLELEAHLVIYDIRGRLLIFSSIIWGRKKSKRM